MAHRIALSSLRKKSLKPLSRHLSNTVQNWAALPMKDRLQSVQDFRTAGLHPLTLKAVIQDFGYETMSTVQQMVLNQSNQNDDLLVRAKTGTGKTLAFLIRALDSVLEGKGFAQSKIPILIISPTRELAYQIGKEAEKLVRHHRLKVEIAVGGTGRSESLKRIINSCDILVGTPGRLLDLISSVPEITDKMCGLKVVWYFF
jgi:ATP-dependent RNA helicase MSS116